LINDVIELSFFFLDDVFLLVLFIIVVVILFIVEVFLRLLLLLGVIRLCHIELIQDVLDLTAKLFIALLHQVLQHFWHSQLLGLLSELPPCENAVKGSINIGTHLQVIVLHKVVEHLQEFNLRLLTLVLSCRSKREVHQQGRRILY
jgi:hypothetical protein